MRSKLKKIWKFIWDDDSVWSWIVNLVIAFLLIRFIIYPLLAITLGTQFPIVAVVSESMEHGVHNDIICGQSFPEFRDSFDNYWDVCGSWYENRGISKDEFRSFPFKNGFDKGDVIVLWRPTNIKVGDVLVFRANKAQPIIHRVVNISDGFYQTKGDHNSRSISSGLEETKISEDRIYGKGLVRVPYLGWMKILFVEVVRPLGIIIER
jgi:signal peptidase I